MQNKIYDPIADVKIKVGDGPKVQMVLDEAGRWAAPLGMTIPSNVEITVTSATSASTTTANRKARRKSRSRRG